MCLFLSYSKSHLDLLFTIISNEGLNSYIEIRINQKVSNTVERRNVDSKLIESHKLIGKPVKNGHKITILISKTIINQIIVRKWTQ